MQSPTGPTRMRTQREEGGTGQRDDRDRDGAVMGEARFLRAKPFG